MKTIRERLELLERTIPGPGVGLLVMTDGGEWEAHRGENTAVFETEAAARDFLRNCQTVIYIDV